MSALAEGVTSETGLAGWLADHGHQVLPPGAGPAEVAEAIRQALTGSLTPQQILSTLPAVDGRLAADAWLFGDAAPVGQERRNGRSGRSASWCPTRPAAIPTAWRG